MDRPNLLLLHGALGSGSQFRELAETLAPRFTVHHPDFEGHGAAADAGRPFRTEHFAENIRAYMDSHGLAQAHVFGYSMGGYVALYLAARDPERVSSLMTLATKIAWTPEFASGEVRFLDPDKIAAKVPAFAQQLERRHEGFGWRNVLAATEEMMRSLGESPDLDDNALERVRQRARIAVGDRDHMVTLEECAEAYRHLPSAELQVLPGTPHPLEKVNVSRLAAALVDFFGE
ncbi:MAG: alpha/beta hydrolase [Ectothiorhodospiraceae bacterium]|jgi:pimeloyl-ACP methyl ester carboxylesterase